MNKFYIFLFILFIIGAVMLYYRKSDEHMMAEELQPIIPIDNTPKKKYNTVINYM